MGEEGHTGLWTREREGALMSVPPESYLPSSHGGRSGQLDRCLSDLLAQAPELEAAAVVSFDGLAMASALPSGMDEDRVAAMSAALLSLGEKAAQGLGRGDLSQVYIEGEYGTVFLVSAQDEAVLVAVAAKAGKTGLMLFEVRRAAAVVGQILAQDGGYSVAPPEPAYADYQNTEPAYQAPESVDQPSYQEPEPDQAESTSAEPTVAQAEPAVTEPTEPEPVATSAQADPVAAQPEQPEPVAADEPVEAQPEADGPAEAEHSPSFDGWSAPVQSSLVMAGSGTEDTHEHYFQDRLQAPAPGQGADEDAAAPAEVQPAAAPTTNVWSPYSPQQQAASS